jgi:hypothetical protein
MAKIEQKQVVVNEIKEKLAALNLSLGMNIDPELLEAPKEDNRLLMQ